MWPVCPGERQDAAAVNGTRPGESDAHSLAIDKATGAVSVTTGEGAVWRSNPTPTRRRPTRWLRGVYKMTMLSQLVIRYVDEDNRSYTATTYANALDSGRRAPDITGGGDAYRVTYRFPTGKAAENRYLSVAVEYALLNGYLQVRVPFDGIEENDRFKLVDISLLPYFGAGSPEDEGYFLLPDGNGAAIDFNTPRTGAVEYAAEVYGRTPVSSSSKRARWRSRSACPSWVSGGDRTPCWPSRPRAASWPPSRRRLPA